MSKQQRVEHDFIVVGAGSSGSVITRRLLDAGYTAHVIEAGPADADERVHSPQGWPTLLQSELDWAVMTTPQRHANGRSLYWPRGKVLGGSSSLNGMIYIRGHRSDYDAWAYQGCHGWDWNSVLPLFKRSEDHVDGENEWHGKGGPLPVTRITDPHPTAVAFVEGALAMGFDQTDDFNGEQMNGVGYNHITVRDGKRMSAWQSFVAPVLGNPSLTVTTGARAHRVLVEGGEAVGVQYSVGGEIRQAYASAEVVLSGGVIGSAQLLLLSGIGPADHLAEVGIGVTANLPGVGENLHDHLLISNVYESAKPLPEGRFKPAGEPAFRQHRRPAPRT